MQIPAAHVDVCSTTRGRLLQKKMLLSFIAQKWLLKGLIVTIPTLYPFKIENEKEKKLQNIEGKRWFCTPGWTERVLRGKKRT